MIRDRQSESSEVMLLLWPLEYYIIIIIIITPPDPKQPDLAELY